MVRLYKLGVAMLLLPSAAWSQSQCDGPVSLERVECLEQLYCPDPQTQDERTACFRRINAELYGDQAAQPVAVDAPADRSELQCDGPVSLERVECLERVYCPDPKTPDERTACFRRINAELYGESAEPVAETPRAPVEREPVAESPRDPESGLVAARSADAPQEWSRVVIVQSGLSGEEVIVLDSGDVYVETKNNPYMKLERNDLVKVTASTLLRKSGGRTQVELVDCSTNRALCEDLSSSR